MGNLSAWLDKAADVALDRTSRSGEGDCGRGFTLAERLPHCILYSGLRGQADGDPHAFDGTLAERWAHATEFYGPPPR